MLHTPDNGDAGASQIPYLPRYGTPGPPPKHHSASCSAIGSLELAEADRRRLSLIVKDHPKGSKSCTHLQTLICPLLFMSDPVRETDRPDVSVFLCHSYHDTIACGSSFGGFCIVLADGVDKA